MPYIISQEVWNLKAADETKALDSEFERCAVVVVEVTTTGFEGTLDIQGKVHGISEYCNVPFIRQDQAGIQTPSTTKITYTSTDTDVYRYVILGYWRRLQLVMTRTAGTITCGVAGSSHAKVFPYITVNVAS